MDRNTLVPQEVIDGILADINAANEIHDEELVAIANELAAGVTGDREAELAGELPAAYTSRIAARAQLDGDTLHVPKAAYTHAVWNQGEWVKTMRGSKLRRPKMDAVVGVAVELDLPDADLKIVNVVVLWRREK